MEFVFSSILSSTDDSCFTLDETWETLESQDLQVRTCCCCVGFSVLMYRDEIQPCFGMRIETDMVLLYSESSGMPWEGLWLFWGRV